MHQAGLQPVNLFECDARLAELGQANTTGRYIVQDVRETAWNRYDAPDVLWASPVCTNASVANAQGGETDMDRECARATVRALETWRPQVFLMENVYGYRHFDSFGIICAALRRLGYGFDYWHLCAADYGVPQTRKRLYLVAVRGFRGRFVRPEPTHAPNPVEHLFGCLEQWNGWYGAIEDLLPDLPESKFADWQLVRMGDAIPSETFLHMTGARSGSPDTGGTGIKVSEHPSGTIRESSVHARPLLVSDYSRGNGEGVLCRSADMPAMTTRACVTGGASPKGLLETGRVVAMTPRALARFQGIPDNFTLSGVRKVDCTGIGNAVIPHMAHVMFECARTALETL